MMRVCPNRATKLAAAWVRPCKRDAETDLTGRAVAPTLALMVAAFSLAAPVQAQEPAAGEWREWSSIIEPSKYGNDFTRYDLSLIHI